MDKANFDERIENIINMLQGAGDTSDPDVQIGLTELLRDSADALYAEVVYGENA